MKKTKIIVIGAGVSGLYTAYLLKNQGFKVQVIEASETFGGRIAAMEGFTDYPIELGAEYIHGKNSLLYELVHYLELPVFKPRKQAYFYSYKGKVISEKEAEKIKALSKALHFLDNQWKYKKEEISIADYLKQQSFYPETRNILEAFAQEYGTTNDKLGMKSVAIEDSLWGSGNKNYKFEGKYSEILSEFLACLEGDVFYNTPISKINYKKKKVVIESIEGQKFKADKVIVSVPLSILKQGYLKFNPPLPKPTLTAIETLGMENGFKLFLKFKKRFWKENMLELIGGELCPAYLVNMPSKITLLEKGEPQEQNHFWETHKNHHILTAFVMGEKADYLSDFGEQQATGMLLQELDTLFGDRLASKNFETSHLMDWGKMPFIQGAYSFSPPNSMGMRKEFAKDLDGKVLFTGEATNFKGHNSTVHGALESAERVVEDVKNILLREIGL